MTIINAYELVKARGEHLVGQRIATEQYGEYPGGCAEIIELFPDLDGAPEIVMQVRNPAFVQTDNPLGEIGIFEWEYVGLLKGTPELGCGDPALVLPYCNAEPCAQTSSHPVQQD